MALVLLALVLVFHFSTWQRLIGRVASGQLTRLRGAARYGLMALLPLLGFVAAIMSLVGIEEWYGVALVSETMARVSPLVGLVLLGVAGLSAVGFAIRCAGIKVTRLPGSGV